ncbi:hypothetical protein RRG08_067219 [Elysia crispata]|uniref:Uncharacterized protein n=1 Tax=Elysia crispata TaxID=231223 RepID=A0AAE1ABT6_9GAST|nr:hypothetical protein RRG08_067219 [Elysia crispata]
MSRREVAVICEITGARGPHPWRFVSWIVATINQEIWERWLRYVRPLVSRESAATVTFIACQAAARSAIWRGLKWRKVVKSIGERVSVP